MTAEKASLSDIDALTELRMGYLREDSGFSDEKEAALIRERLPEYFRAHLNRDLFAYLIRREGIAAACAFLLVVEKPMSPSFPNGKTGTVLNVYTLPSFRRRGYARGIMEALLEDAEKMGLSRVDLKATEAGYPLYRSVGFTDGSPKYRSMTRSGTPRDPSGKN